MVLNSPWFDMQGAALAAQPGDAPGDRTPRHQPTDAGDPRRISDVYGRSLHREHGGEWDYDLTWKPLESRPVYVGWLRAVRRGHALLHAGLDIDSPTLVLSSARSFFGEQTEETAATHDIVLDVEQIRRWASSVGRHVTSIAVEGAIHDVVLSRPPVRQAGVRRPRQVARRVGARAEASKQTSTRFSATRRSRSWRRGGGPARP